MNGLELSGYLVSNLMGNDGTSEEGGVILLSLLEKYE